MEIKQKNRKQMEVLNILFLFACILLIGVKYWLHNNKGVSNQPLSVETNNRETGNTLSNEREEVLLHTYDTINMWANNCDQKANILLATIGVIISIIISSDFIKYIKTYIFTPFIDYWTGNSELAFSWSRFNVFVLLLISVIMLIISCNYLFKTICANIDDQKMRKANPELVTKSYIFFGTISRMSYGDFKNNEVNYLEDLKSQIYVNSKIVTNKFLNYNKSLYWFKFLLCVSLMLFIAIMFMK